MARLSIYVCGQLRLVLDGKALTLHASSKAQALLAYLAVEAGREHPRERLAGLFWPELPEKRARQNLSQTLYVIRRELGETEAREYYLSLTTYSVTYNTHSDYWLDYAELIRLVEACERHAHPHKLTCPECQERLEQAVAIYRGSFLADFSLKDTIEFDEWCTLTRERTLYSVMQIHQVNAIQSQIFQATF